MEALYKKNVLGFVTTIVLLGGALIGLWQFGMSMRVKELRAQEIKEHLASYEQNKKVFAEESIELQKINERIGKLETHRVTVDTVPQLLSSLESMATAEGIVFDITTVHTPKNAEDAQTLVIDFAATGSYVDIATYLDRLASQPYGIRFTRFSLYRSTQTQDTLVATPEVTWELLASMEVLSF